MNEKYMAISRTFVVCYTLLPQRKVAFSYVYNIDNNGTKLCVIFKLEIF
jgi:hypothetical protein